MNYQIDSAIYLILCLITKSPILSLFSVPLLYKLLSKIFLRDIQSCCDLYVFMYFIFVQMPFFFLIDKDLQLLRQSTSSHEGHGTEPRRGSLPGSTGRHNSPNRLVIEEEPAFRYCHCPVMLHLFWVKSLKKVMELGDCSSAASPLVVARGHSSSPAAASSASCQHIFKLLSVCLSHTHSNALRSLRCCASARSTRLISFVLNNHENEPKGKKFGDSNMIV